MLPVKTSAHHFNSKIKFDIVVNCAWCVDWVFHSRSENTEEFSILGLNVPNSPYGHLLLLVKVMIHISSLSCSFYIRHITEITLLFFGCSVAPSCWTFWDPMDCSTPDLSVPRITQRLPKFMSTESVMPSNHFNLCRPLLLQPSIFPSIRVFSNEPALDIRWPKYQSSVSAPVLPINIQGWFPLGLTGLISLLSKGLSRVFSNTTVPNYQFFSIQLFFMV